jgi:Cys-tRNA(Pro) deacylase
MSIESVKEHIENEKYNLTVIELSASSATVELAAEAIGVEPDRIAKTMAFRIKDKEILVVTKGGARIDNRKFKENFNSKAKMLKADEVVEITGHPIGGVCPFGLKNPLEIYLDTTLQDFDFVYPAGGSTNSAVKISVNDLENITEGQWVDVCK